MIKAHATLVWCLFILAPVSVSFAASDVWVRATERDGHSRLIFHFDHIPEWKIEPIQPNEIFLRLEPAPDAYRIDDISRRMPGSRVHSIRQDAEGRGLVLSLNCDCALQVSTMADRLLLVDIRDPSPASITATPDAISLSALRPQLVMSHTQGVVPDVSPETQVPTLPLVTRSLENPPWFELPDTPSETPVGETMSRALSRGIARAAAAGLVDADTSPQERAEADPPGANSISTTSDLDDLIRLRTGLDRVFSSQDNPLPQLAPQLSCPPAEDFDLLTWGEDKEPYLQIGKSRQYLMGEFDQLDAAAVLDFVKLNIFLTFDVEAQNALDRMIPDHPQHELLSAIAGVVGSTVPSAQVAGLSECGGSLPLIAFLAASPDDVQSPPRREALLLTYSALPTFLRRHFAAGLAERFSALGDKASVDLVLTAVGRVTPQSDPSVVMASGKGAATGELGDATEAALRDLATSLRPEAGEALLINIEERLIDGGRIPRDLIDTAGILAFEQAAGEMGERFKAVQIKALLSNGSLAEGFDELLRARDQALIAPNEVEELWRYGIANLLERAPDAEFAGLLFEPSIAGGLPMLPDTLRRDLAERLLALGFPTYAQNVWGAPSSENPVFAARMAKAELDLSRAADLTRPVTTRDARAILAEVLSRSGQHDEAYTVLSEFSDDDRLSEEAWRAGNWNAVQDAGAAERVAAAEAMAALDDETASSEPGEDPTLEGSQALVDSSRSLRETIKALLDTTSSEDGES